MIARKCDEISMAAHLETIAEWELINRIIWWIGMAVNTHTHTLHLYAE